MQRHIWKGMFSIYLKSNQFVNSKIFNLITKFEFVIYMMLFCSKDFMVYGDRLMRLLAEEALCRLPSIVEGEVITPCGVSKGFVEKRKMDICLVSVVRSGIL